MLRVPHWALTALLALIISVVPFGASWAESGRGNGRDSAPAHGRDKQEEDRQDAEEEDPDTEESPEAESSRSPHQAENDEQDPQRRRSSASEETSNESTPPEAPADAIDVSFSASPASIAVGETSTLQVAVSNPGPDPVSGVEVLVELPDQLEVVSTDPQGPTGKVLELPLGDIGPGVTATATVVVIALDRPGAVQPLRFAVTADGETYHHELLVSVEQAAAHGLGLVQSSPLLIQVGDASSFSATLTNDSGSPLEDVAVIAEIAPELDVVGVEPIAEADAIQLGVSPAGEDVVWIFGSLGPGEQVHMTWTARAVAPGDLEAGNLVEARLGGKVAASSQQDTYLGFVKGVRTERSAAPAPVVRERVVTKLVPVSTETAASVGGGILPVTGWSPTALGFGGALLIALGALSLWASNGPRNRRLSLILVGALLLTATACVSDDGGTEVTGPSPETSPSPEVNPEDEEKEDEVLGLRIQRPEPEGADSEPPAPVAAPDTVSPPVAEPETEIVYEEVSEVVRVVVPVAELPMEPLGPRAGDNTLSFSWDPATADLQATSGRIISADATEGVLVGLSTAGDRLTATVSVANLTEGRRLHVEGRLVLDIISADGRTSALMSDPIDVVLDPGATTSADLAFSLPAGNYTAKGAFVTD